MCGCVFVLLFFFFVDEIIFFQTDGSGLVGQPAEYLLCRCVAVIDNNFHTGFFCILFCCVLFFLLFSDVLSWKFISIFEEKEDLIIPAEDLWVDVFLFCCCSCFLTRSFFPDRWFLVG